MRKFFLIAGSIVVVTAILCIYLLFSASTQFEKEKKYIYIKPGIESREQVLMQMDSASIINRKELWKWMMDASGSWGRITPGRFEVKKEMSLYDLVFLFRHNNQSAVKLIINKLRTPHELARLVGKNFMTDSSMMLSYMTNNDSLLQAGFTSDTWMTAIIPNTYEFNWTATPRAIFSRLKNEQEKFWAKNDRQSKAASMGLSLSEIYTIASIVEEETNKNDEKGNVASVYINRVNKGMPLGADPTIKFALKDFTLKRILFKHLDVVSPYNTYRNAGLPPGPICTPQIVTIDAVLNAPKTDYLFFVAKSDFSGYHHFSATFAEHNTYAKEYQDSLNAFLVRKQQQK